MEHKFLPHLPKLMKTSFVVGRSYLLTLFERWRQIRIRGYWRIFYLPTDVKDNRSNGEVL